MEANHVAYDAIRRSLLTGDILLARPDAPHGDAIAIGTGSPYSHAAMIGWAGGSRNGGVLLMGEACRWGCRVVTLSSQVRLYPGLYDVWRVIPPKAHDKRLGMFWHPATAWATVMRAAGSDYGWRSVLRMALRTIMAPSVAGDPNSDDPARPRFCSELVAFACRMGGRTLVDAEYDRPRLDSEVTPGMLANPTFARYVATLWASEDQIPAIEVDPCD